MGVLSLVACETIRQIGTQSDFDYFTKKGTPLMGCLMLCTFIDELIGFYNGGPIQQLQMLRQQARMLERNFNSEKSVMNKNQK